MQARCGFGDLVFKQRKTCRQCGFGDLVFKQRKTCRHGVGLVI